MIKDITLSGLNGYVFDERTLKYLLNQVSLLGRKIPKKWHKFVAVSIVIKIVNKPHNNKYDMVLSVNIDGASAVIHDTNANVAALTDVAMVKMCDKLMAYFHF